MEDGPQSSLDKVQKSLSEEERKVLLSVTIKKRFKWLH